MIKVFYQLSNTAIQIMLSKLITHKGKAMINSRLKDKTILITGAGTGMGRASALRLAEEGAQLVLLGRRLDPLETTVNEIQSYGGTAVAISCDIAQEDALSETIQSIVDKFGSLDGVFANAGVLGDFKPLQETNAADLESLISTNLRGTFLTLKHCLNVMQSGSVLINASWTANGVMPGAGAYAATKGALLAMMKTLAVEQGKRGIRVNAINPGIILTPMADDVLSPELSAQLAAHTALGRNGTPEDVSGTVAWLLSEDSAFVTGQEITIDGGYTIGGLRL
jgi:NAD(P)-dependent dehydrogenase (short-subunit alcohol dehydrogenase family)